MPAVRRLSAFVLAAGTTLAVACTKSTPAVTVTINSPAEGDTVNDMEVRIDLAASGIEIAPAAENRAGTAHHHLYLDTDFPATDGPIPAGQQNIVHLGLGQTQYTWQGLLPGPHRIIAVLADPGHVPIKPLVADTVNFVTAMPQPVDTTIKK